MSIGSSVDKDGFMVPCVAKTTVTSMSLSPGNAQLPGIVIGDSALNAAPRFPLPGRGSSGQEVNASGSAVIPARMPQDLSQSTQPLLVGTKVLS